MFDFNEQVVLVTGGTGTLGSTLVRAFAQAGARTIVPDRKTGRLDTLFPELAGDERHLLAEGVDVSLAEDVAGLVETARERFDHIDILVNAVGGYQGGVLVHETSIDAWGKMMTMNARIPFIVCRAVLPLMQDRGRGTIVNVGAHNSLEGAGGEAVYSASKGAVARLTESMSKGYRDDNVRVNAVLPAAMVDADRLAADPHSGVTPSQVKDVILFLCSPLSAGIHGALIPVFGRHF